jgi:microcystin-dependent protein
LPSPPADSRFDMIVARVTNGVPAITTVSGTSSATNPTFPKSRSVLTGGFSPSLHIDLNTDVVLAAIYRTGASTVTNARIADKRVLQASSIALQGIGYPSAATGYGTGNLYFKNDTEDVAGDTTSGVYVKLASGEWIELAKNIGLHLPIGAMVEWPTSASVPDGFLEPIGQALATDAYPSLFAVYGYQHGGSEGTFNLPDYRDVVKRGTSTGALAGTLVSGSADTTTLTLANLAPHTHANTHTHSYSHSHSIVHGHTGSFSGTATGGSHTHSYSRVSSNNGASATGGYAFYNNVYSAQTGGASHTHSVSGSVSIGTYSGSTTSQSSSITSTSTDPTGSAGSAEPFSRIPAAKHVRNIIRVS